MGLIRQLSRKPYSIYRAPRYLTSKPIGVGRHFGPVRYAPALAWRDAYLISNVLNQKRGLSNYQKTNTLPMPVYTSGSDRRMWHPLGRNRPAVNTSGVPVTPTDVSIYTPDWEKLMTPPHKIDWRPKLSTQLKNAPWWYGFKNADKVLICLERKARREIMHAFGFAGKTGQKTPHYGPFSRVRC